MEGLSPWIVIPAAFVLDMLLGDPRRFPHPVRWMGRSIVSAEPWFRRLPIHPVWAGGWFAAVLVAGTWGGCTLVIDACGEVRPSLGTAVEIVMVYFCLSIRSLHDAAMEIFTLLSQQRAAEARARLALIVGRDVERYQSADMARAAVETVAENFVDGVLSPLLFAAVGGAPLAMAFKMVSTLDSMVGYKNPRYLEFGWAGARLDDAMNFLPARLSIVFLALGAAVGGMKALEGLRVARRDRLKHESPNSAHAESFLAGALGLRLGGPTLYADGMKGKPWLGDGRTESGPADIRRGLTLLRVTGWISLVATVGMIFLIR